MSSIAHLSPIVLLPSSLASSPPPAQKEKKHNSIAGEKKETQIRIPPKKGVYVLIGRKAALTYVNGWMDGYDVMC